MIHPPAEHWWTCPLDVEQLARAAVERSCAATSALAARRGDALAVTTSAERIAAAFAAMENLHVPGRDVVPWGPMSGFLHAADGWVRLHANYPHHARAAQRALGVRTRDELVARVAASAAQDVEEAVRDAGGIATVVRTEKEWARHPQAVATTGRPWVQREPAGSRTGLPHGSGPLPMRGVRVLDLTRVVAGPSCSQLLACLGADVLRVDPPDRPELPDAHLASGMGKRSAQLDLATHGGQARELTAGADVVLIGYRPGALTRFGLDPDSLSERHRHLVVASLSAWGETGPWGARAGFDSIVQAASGIAAICGGLGDESDARPPRRPGALPVQALDHSSGYVLAAEVMDMLARDEAGIVRVSLLGAARELLSLPRRSAVEAPDVETFKAGTVEVDSSGGPVQVPPPAILLDSRTIERPITGYGAARAEWAVG